MAKRFSTRGLSKHRSYTLEDAAMIIGASKQTLRHWSKHDGLVVMTAKIPHIVHGSVLIAHIESKKPKKRPKLLPAEFDCWTCKTRGKPFGLMADYEPITAKTGRMAALCGHCEGGVSRITSLGQLPDHASILQIVNRAA